MSDAAILWLTALVGIAATIAAFALATPLVGGITLVISLAVFLIVLSSRKGGSGSSSSSSSSGSILGDAIGGLFD